MLETSLEGCLPQPPYMRNGTADTEFANRVKRRVSQGSRLRKSKLARFLLCAFVLCCGAVTFLTLPVVDIQEDTLARTLRPSACPCQKVVPLHLEPGSPERVALLVLFKPCLLDLRSLVKASFHLGFHQCLLDLSSFVRASFRLACHPCLLDLSNFVQASLHLGCHPSLRCLRSFIQALFLLAWTLR